MKMRFGLPPRKPRSVNKLYKVNNISVYAPTKAEAKKRMMEYLGTQIIKAVNN